MSARPWHLVAFLLLNSILTNAQNLTVADTVTANRLFIQADSLKNAGEFDASVNYFMRAALIYQKNKLWPRYLRCINKVSENYWRQGKFDSSAVKATLALQESMARMGHGNIEQASAYVNLGVINDEKGNSQKALQYYQKALAIQLEKVGAFHPVVANTYNNLAILMNNMGNDQEAFKYYQKCMTIYLKLYGEISIKTANTLNNIGSLYLKKSDYNKALAYFKNSLEIKRKIPGDHRLVTADSYNNLGIVYSNTGDYKESLENFEKALYIKKEILGSDHYMVANTYSSMGVVYYHLGDYDKVLENYKKALNIEKQVFGINSSAVSLEYMRMGIVYVDQGAFDLGLEYYQQALDISEHPGEGHQDDVSRIYSNMGVAWLYKKGYSRALDYFEKALTIQIETSGNVSTDVAITYNNLGEVYLAKEDYATALHFFRQSLFIKKQIYGEKNYLVANTYANMARVFQAMNEFPQSLKYYQKAIRIDQNLYGEKNPGLANIFTDLAKTYLEQKDFSDGLAVCQQAIIANVINFNDTSVCVNPKLQDYMNGYYLLSSLKLKGELWVRQYENTRKLENIQLALTTFQLCDSLFNKIRDEQQKNEDKISLSAVSASIYQNAVKSCYILYSNTGNISFLKKAFYFSEQSKSAVLKQAVANNSARNLGGIPDSLQSLEKELKLDRAYYQSRVLSEEVKNPEVKQEKLDELQSKLFRINRKYDSLISSFEQNYPKYYQLKYKNNVSSVASLQNGLSDTSAALAEYFISDSTAYIFMITKDQFNVISTSLDENFGQSIRTFRKQLDAGALLNNPKQAYLEFTTTSQQLYRQLFVPLQSQLTNKITRLIIIPHGILSYIPFGILAPDGPGKNIDYKDLHYLLKDFDINYAYTATLWQQANFQSKSQGWDEEFAGFAPSYPTDLLTKSPVLREYGKYRDNITDLASTHAEIQNALKFFPGQLFAGEKATETAFKKQAPRDRIVHLAMHAIVDEKNPLESKLIFYNNGDSTNDGFLNAYELYNMDLNADMAVLSACNTGYGRLAQGEGVMSLSRAFSYAGCRSLVMSLWEANDKSTAEIMRLFYKNLYDGNTKDEALRKAKLSFLNQADPLTAHPLFWGGFIVNGDVSPINTMHTWLSTKHWIMSISTFLVFIFFVQIIYRNLKKRTRRNSGAYPD